MGGYISKSQIRRVVSAALWNDGQEEFRTMLAGANQAFALRDMAVFQVSNCGWVKRRGGRIWCQVDLQ